MLELLGAYSLKEIISFIVIFALAVKGLISFFEWGIPKIFKFVHKADEQKTLYQKVEEIEKEQEDLKHYVKLLIKSSILDFRSQLVKDHRYFTERGWVDHYSLEALEDQFKVYVEEGGNSFAEQLMKEIRALSKEPLKNKEGE